MTQTNGIENVTVKLIEYIIKDNGEVVEIERPGLVLKNNKILVNRKQSIKTDGNGEYTFNVEGGNYAIKFIYGNTEMLCDDYANKKYNGQDYQATTYTSFSDIGENAYKTVKDLKNGITNKLVIDELDIISQKVGVQADVQAEWETEEWGKDKRNNASTARDNATIRAKVIKSANELTYDNASKLNELNVVDENKSVSSNEVAEYLSGKNNVNAENYTYMEAISDIIVIASNDLVKTEKVMNLGLKERPKASIKLEKKVTRIVLTANDGTVLIDTKDTTKQSNLQKLNDIQTTYMSMDSILMDGATIDIDYKLTVRNDATEDDCLANYVYINSDKDIFGLENLNDKLSVKATIFDYVSINLEYRADDNKQTSWSKVYDGDSKPSNVDYIILADSVLETLPRTEKVVSKVLSTSSDDLLSQESQEFDIHLGMTLAENTSNTDLDFIFSNSAEVVKINSQAGRRDYDTIPGNYVPYNEPDEDDCAKTGTTAITPPFGQDGIYYVIAIISAGIIITGIILIKKKVLGK